MKYLAMISLAAFVFGLTGCKPEAPKKNPADEYQQRLKKATKEAKGI